MSKAPTKRAPKKKGANGYKLPEPIAKGEIVTDLKKQKWIIGTSIGVGGFGEIYCAAPYKDKTPTEYPSVIKIEPHENGPLFVEMHFYMRNANVTDINNWKKEKKLPHLGMPPFLGSGSHEYKGQKYRFVIMERYGTDLWKLFLENDRIFPEHTVYKVSWQIINVLEYIHNKTYVHADIKGANLLLDLKSQNNVYLVDFGLSSHYTSKEEYKLDPKKAHNGTIEYTSRDAHMGVPTMRGDFEILLYNMIQWLCGMLPWEKNLKEPAPVQQQKEKAFNNIQAFLKECFKTSEIPTPISQFMSLLASINFNETPNYNKFRDILVKGLQKLNHTPTGKLEFSMKKPNKLPSTPKRTKATTAENKESAKKTKPVSTAKSPRGKRQIALTNESLNSSIDSIILDEKCINGRDMRIQLANIDCDAEYEVQIKKRKTKTSPQNDNTPTKPPAKRGRKKIIKPIDTSITDSEPEVQIIKRGRKKIIEPIDISITDSEPEVVSKGTKSRPGSKTASKDIQKTVPRKQLSQYDSEKDIFEDSFDD